MSALEAYRPSSASDLRAHYDRVRSNIRESVVRARERRGERPILPVRPALAPAAEVPAFRVEYPALPEVPVEIGRITCRAVKRAFIERYHITIEELCSSRRTAPLVKARHICWIIVRKFSTLSLPHVGRQFGGKDHTTILHGVKKHEAAVNALVAERKLTAETPIGDLIEAIAEIVDAAGTLNPLKKETNSGSA